MHRFSQLRIRSTSLFIAFTEQAQEISLSLPVSLSLSVIQAANLIKWTSGWAGIGPSPHSSSGFNYNSSSINGAQHSTARDNLAKLTSASHVHAFAYNGNRVGHKPETRTTRVQMLLPLTSFAQNISRQKTDVNSIAVINTFESS